MKKLIILIILPFISCTNTNENNGLFKSEIIDTIKIYDTIKSNLNYNTKIQIEDEPDYREKLKELLELINTSKPDKKLFKIIDIRYSEYIMIGVLNNDEAINDILLLFFLKLHSNNIIKSPYGYNVSCCREEYVSLMLFSLQYYKISNFRTSEILLTYYIYEWLKTQPKYFENQYIKKETENIESIIKKNNIHYDESLKLSEDMFYN